MTTYNREVLLAKAAKAMRKADKTTVWATAQYYINEAQAWIALLNALEDEETIEVP